MGWKDIAKDLVGATLLGAVKDVPFLGRAVEVVSTVMESRKDAEDKRRLEAKVDLLHEKIGILGKQNAAIFANTNRTSALVEAQRSRESDCLVRLPVPGETKFRRLQREAVEGVLIEVLANLRRQEIDGATLDQIVREIVDIHKAGYGITLFEGLFGGTGHYDMLRRNPGLYGRVLDDSASLAPGQIPILLSLDKTRILEVPAMSLAALLRSARRDSREIVTGHDLWALPRDPSPVTDPPKPPLLTSALDLSATGPLRTARTGDKELVKAPVLRAEYGSRAQEEFIEKPVKHSREVPYGRKICRYCREVSFDVVPLCPSCRASDWWD